MLIAAYFNVQVYAAFQESVGRGPKLQAMWDLWGPGDRKRRLEAISDEVVDELVVHGRRRMLGACRALRGQRGHDSGADAAAVPGVASHRDGPPARPDAEHGRMKRVVAGILASDTVVGGIIGGLVVLAVVSLDRRSVDPRRW